MAQVVAIVGVAHNPFLPALLRQPAPPPSALRFQEGFTRAQAWLRARRPESLVVVASDHMHLLFMDNMPSFLVGKAPSIPGIFPNEAREWGLVPCEVAGDLDLAGHVIAEGLRQGVDFAYTNELTVDHGFAVPLQFLRPEMDLPVVPIFTNTFAPPLPPAERFYQVGLSLRGVLDAYPRQRRVAVIASGHLSVEVGGPKQMAGPYDLAFDAAAVEWMRRGDAAGAIRESTFERLQQAGNATHGFLNFILALGVARGAPATEAYHLSEAPFGSLPFFAWDLEAEPVGAEARA